jgi:gas vesicle protein
MVTQNRRIDDPLEPWSTSSRSEGGFGAGGLLVGTLLGIGIGLLAAPQPGTATRKQLLKRLAAFGEEAGGTFEDVQDLTAKARKKARKRLSQLREDAVRVVEQEDDHDFSPFSTILAIAAGVAATYLLTSDRAEPVRARVQHAADDVKRRAVDEWDRFQRGGFRARRSAAGEPEGRSETRAGSSPSNEAPEAS